MASGTPNDLRGVWGDSASDVFAVGHDGTIIHYDGSAWAPMISNTTEDLNGVWETSSVAFAVGDNGTILRMLPGVPAPPPTPTAGEFDCSKSLYITNEGNGGGGRTIVRADCNGIITTYATGFNGPSGAVFDEATGNLIISDDYPGIHSVDAAGNITPVATNVVFANPNGLAVDALGRLLVADSGSRVLRITLNPDLSAATVENLAQGFAIPQGVVETPAGDVLFTDVDGYVYRITPSTPLPITAPATAQRLAVGQIVQGNQGSIKLDAAGNIYTSNFGWRIVRITPDGQTFKDVVSIPVSTCPTGQSGNTVPGFQGLVFDPEGDLAVTGLLPGQHLHLPVG